MLKALNTGRVNGRMEPIVIEDIPVFSGARPVTALRVYSRRHGDRNSARLIAMSRDELRSLPLHRCGRTTTCSYVLLTYLLNFLTLKGPVESC